MGYNNKDAYMRAFLDRYTSLISRGADDRVISAYVSMYNKNKLVNAITGKADECTHNGKKWKVTQADGGGNNVFEPGVWGWTQV